MPYRLPTRALLSVCVLLLAACEVVAQNEPATSTARTGYPAQWPAGPPATSVPAWAHPGNIRFARWDGGPIETAKGFLSGWPGMNPPLPDYVFTTTNWYEPGTVQFLRDGHFNLIWVTFSAGFSIPTEKVQRDLLRVYIEECHRHGIHVMAYESVANIFWEDMFQKMPESKNWVRMQSDGKPVPYGAANYNKMGRVTRYMADVMKPQWRDLLKKRIDLAVEAGADGVMYDNCAARGVVELADLFQELMRYALGRKKDFLIMANFHRNSYVVNRLLNCITTEDGGEAGVFSEKNLLGGLRRGERSTMLPADGGLLVNNVGLFRIFENLAEGWKPVMIESNLREVSDREEDFMRPARQQLAVAEPMMFNVSNETFVDLRFAHDLYRSEPAALAAWKAIGRYNRFFAEHADYYRGAKSVATLALVIDDRSEDPTLMNALAARNVLFNVLYEHELTPQKLAPYAAVALLSANTVRDRAIDALEAYMAAGGKVLWAPSTAAHDENGRRRQPPAWVGKKHGQGECIAWQSTPPIDRLAAELKAADRRPLVRVAAPPGVLCNVTKQIENGRLMIHLLNYRPRPVDKVLVTLSGRYEAAVRLTPDDDARPPRVVHATDALTEIEIAPLTIYSLLVLGHGR
jgi:hypothetical protein